MPTVRRSIPTLPEPISAEARLRVQTRQAVAAAEGAATMEDVDAVRAQIPDVSAFATTTQVATAKTSAISTAASDAASKANAAKDAAIAAIPPLASTTPSPEMTGGSAGAAVAVPRADHAHPRLTSTTGPHTLDATGKVTVLFTRSFTKAPGLAFTRVVDTDVQERPVDMQATYIVTAGLYVGVIVRARRSSVLPTLAPLTGITLLSALVTGVNAISAALTGFDVFGTPAVGVKFTCIAVQSSE